MNLPKHLLPQTTVVGSYPQPEWLVDRGDAVEIGVPRTRMHAMVAAAAGGLWNRAQDDATIVAIRDMEARRHRHRHRR